MRLNLIAPINDLGYGYTGLHLTDELIKLGHDVALFPIGKPYCHFRHEDNIKKALQNADKWDNDAPCIRLWHQHDLSMFVGHGKHIGFPIFELDTFSDKEKHHLGNCDELMVCSRWALNVCATNLFEIDKNKPIKIVPLGVDNEIFTPKLSKRKPTIFFNCGKWEKRKGHYELIQAFNLAFNEDSNVELWMMCQNPFLNKEQADHWHNRCKNSKMGHKIRILPRVEADTQVADIMQQADCGVFPSRGEGWNLEALEMLACGKQVIATDYSAHTEFLTQENAWLVPINGVEPAYDGIWFHKQGNWGSFDNNNITILIERMQFIHDKKQNGDLEINEAGLETAQKFSWTNTAKTLIQNL
jgi:glycosyltransferase involved in cell wall biosynthesis